MRSDVVAGALILTAAAVVAGWLVVRDYQSVRAALRARPILPADPPAAAVPRSLAPDLPSTQPAGAPRFSAVPQRRGFRGGARRGRGRSIRGSSAAPIGAESAFTPRFS